MSQETVPDPDVFLREFDNKDAQIFYTIHVGLKLPAEELSELEKRDPSILLNKALEKCPVNLDQEGVSALILVFRVSSGIETYIQDGSKQWVRVVK